MADTPKLLDEKRTVRITGTELNWWDIFGDIIITGIILGLAILIANA